ncbi:hypothetical protein [Tautonia rosea]|uniref:hypothetical protein n=1 Tax=Tautonia rosea TaxID=2728037 RepID=UPI001473FB07|nr:hypothetical protein [Tautonia rosea]
MPILRGFLALMLVAVCSATASAQLYPGPFMRGGWGGFGTGGRDPGADYLRGSGYYMRAQADYQVKAAEASKLRAEAYAKWNQTISEARKAKEIRDAQARDRQAVETAIVNREGLVEAGILLNQTIDQILDFPTDGTHDALAAIPLGADVLRDIPFENASEPITACLAILTQEDGWPPLLRETEFEKPRETFSKAITAALAEDLNGSISDSTRSELDDALSELRIMIKSEQNGFPVVGADDADQFLRTLAGMIRLLEDPQGGAVYRMIQSYEQGTMADLVGFMHAYNLRFGRAKTDRQKEIYRQFDAMLTSIPVAQGAAPDVATKPLVESSKLVGDSAKELFSNLSWDDIDKAGSK